MTKTLTISIKDFDDTGDFMTISGTKHDNAFNETVILSIGETKIAVDSLILAKVLAEIVAFQSPQIISGAV